VPATALSGVADWSTVDNQRTKRVGLVHAIGNSVVASAYLLSWRSRRRGNHARGVVLGLVGGTLAWGTGYLGGHMSFARGVGVGERGLDTGVAADEGAESSGSRSVTVHSSEDLLDIATAAEMLTVQTDQIWAMVEGGILTPAGGEGDRVSFRRTDVMAARELGG
jgi:hypothetical protein